MNKRLLILLVVIINSTISFLLWRIEFNRPNIEFSKAYEFLGIGYPRIQNLFYPLTGVPLSFLISLSMTLTLFLFDRTNKAWSYFILGVITFATTAFMFYLFKYIFYKEFVSTFFFKYIGIPLGYIFGFVFVTPIYLLLIVKYINLFTIKADKLLYLSLLAAFISIIPLSLLCTFLFDSQSLKHNLYFYTSIVNGYPVFFINLNLPLSTFLFFNNFRSKKPV